MNRNKLMIHILLALALTSTTYAAETPSYEMEEIIVHADPIQQATDATNVNVKKISPGKASTLPELLSHVTGIDIQVRTGHGDNDDGAVKLRGFDSRRFTVLVDGVPATLSGVMGGSYMDWDSIPLNTIEKIEIIKGGKSAAYGNTLGGVINIITRKATAAGGEISILTGQYNKQQLRFNYGATQDKLGWQVSYNKSSEDAFLRNNDYDAKQYGLKLDYAFTPKDNVKLNVRQSEEKRGYILRNTPGTAGYDPSYPVISATDAETAYSNYGPLNNGAYWKKYNTNFDTAWTHQTNNGFITLDYWQSRERRHEVNFKTDGTLDLDRTIVTDRSRGWLLNGRIKEGSHTYTYGTEYKQLRYGYGWYNVPAGTASDLYPSQKEDIYGIYADDTWALTNRWTANVGLRYDQMKASRDDERATDMKDTNYHGLSPKLNFSFRNNKDTTTFIAMDHVWRAPSMAEYFWWLNPMWGKLGTGRELKPEQGWSYELGMTHRVNEQFNTKFDFYYQDISDYINFEHQYPFSCYNIPNAKLWGFEWENNYQLNEYSSLMLNYTNQHTQKSGVLPGDKLGLSGELDYRPRHKIGLTYLYDQKPWQFRYNVTYTGQQTANYPVGSTQKIGIGGYVVHSASLVRDLGKGRSCTLAVDNLFDKHYVEQYNYSMQGRLFSVSLTQKL
ncbi:outer membrane receptor protein involved in Fe transport [Sporomusaceae bacterium BoRhaA]|uniref:TonB-dependent receptor plug domain-containing protein n=1 Tax=Pelorhabdus rhamnosifermentans TaxID=2772457 RepID=UPI001C05F0E1|nr:TonB-dependent receptor [Pelorhabdus rhamnosifermentans]MBU2700302.1 outer membrane receptor protein involved in Fe transport [Pelorhabdus rhamnosifermentans]